jgi:hypothetical protein
MNQGLPSARVRPLAALALVLLALPASAKDLIDGLIVYGNSADLRYQCTAADPGYLSYSNNDLGVAPLPGFSPVFPSVDFQPDPSSIASGNIDNVATLAYQDADPCNGCGALRFVEQTCFRGAIDPNGANWTAGWTVSGDLINVNPPGWETRPFKFLAGPQPTSFWDADTNYVLQGKVSFPVGTSLTIQAGTLIVGENATGGYLVIDRDADIFANGTVSNPIVMTTDLDPPISGGWGGLVIHGKAVANCADCLGGASCISEGGAGEHCGTNDCDDSGSLSYVRIAYSGVEISVANELNSFTFNSVGSGTELQFLQAHQGSDDAFEWFGGHSTAKYLVATGTQDDGLDWQMGYRGAVQFAIVQAYPTSGDKGIEADNNEFGFDAPCRSNPIVANVTLIGNPDVAATNQNGTHFRRGTDFQFFNSIVVGWKQQGIRIEHDATCNGLNPQTATYQCGARVDAPVVANAVGIEVRTVPNPVVNRTSFEFALPASGRAQLDVFDVAGRRVANVLNEASLEAGSHAVSWTPPSTLPAGAYFYRLTTDSKPVQGRFVVVR